MFLDPEEETSYYIEEVIEGTSIARVLDIMVQYDEKASVRSIKKQIHLAISGEQLKPFEGMKLLANYAKGLRDQTYLSL